MDFRSSTTCRGMIMMLIIKGGYNETKYLQVAHNPWKINLLRVKNKGSALFTFVTVLSIIYLFVTLCS